MSESTADSIWAAVSRWVDVSPSLEAIEAHRIGLLAARRYRETGREVPQSLLREERDASVVAMTAPRVLERVRELLDGPIVLFKGLEVAELYDDPFRRCSFHDLDVLVPDAIGAQRRLVEAGFRGVGDAAIYRKLHHLQPLALPGLPILVEVHRHPKWLRWSEPPPPARLFHSARPSASGVAGIDRLSPAHHALVLAAHSWSNSPLGRLRDLLDICLVAREASREELLSTAREWGMAEVWRATAAAYGSLIDPKAAVPIPLRTWARSLRAADRPGSAEAVLRRAMSPFWAMSASAVPRAVAGIAYRDLLSRVRGPRRSAR